MMKYLALMFAVLVGAVSCVYAQATRSAAASQAWVENYVSNFVAKSAGELLATTKRTESNGTISFQVGDGKLVIDDASDAALKVLNSVCAVENGTLFIWDGGNKYINKTGMIEATKTNMVYQGVHSSVVNGMIHFDGFFDVAGVLVTAQMSLATTNKVEVVR